MIMIQQPVSRRCFLQAAGTLTGLSLLAACAPVTPTEPAGDEAPTGSRRGGTLTVVLPGMATSLDPALVRGYDMHVLILSIYEPLAKLDTERVAQPALAEAWEVSQDGLQWTFTVRPDVTFHPGAPLEAEDVVHTYARVLDPDLGFPYRQVLQFVTGVEALDASTVQFTLQAPNIDFPQYLSTFATCIVPRDRSDEELATTPSGTGPFRLTEYVPGEYAYAVRNESYRIPDLPYLDEVRHVYMTEPATQIAALASGTADVLWQVGVESLSTLEGNPDVQILEVAAGSYQPIHMCATEPPFDDLRVRQAMRLVADRQAIIDLVLGGAGTVTCDTPVAPSDVYRREGDCPQDIEGAKALLAEAGYADGIDVTLYTSDSSQEQIPMSEVYQQQAAAAGINVTLEIAPSDSFWSDVWRVEPLVTTFWHERPADEILNLNWRSTAAWNESYFQDAEFDQLLDEARTALDFESRRDLYLTAQQLLAEEGGHVIPFHVDSFHVASAALSDVLARSWPHIEWHLISKSE